MKESMESWKIFLFIEINTSKLIKYLTNMCQNYEDTMIIKIKPKLDLISRIETFFSPYIIKLGIKFLILFRCGTKTEIFEK